MGANYRLTMRSGVSAMNDNVIGLFHDEATARWVGQALLEADKLAHPEYRSFDVRATAKKAGRLESLEAGAAEYNAWIMFHAAGEGDYDDFLRAYLKLSERDNEAGNG